MWKKIPNYENYLVNENGEVLNTETNKLIIGDINSSGYYRITLYSKNGKKRIFRHRLVAMMFIDNPKKLKEVNHIDGNKANNSVTNLEWCSRKYNELHARRTHIKEYKPFKVVFNDEHEEIFEVKSTLSEKLKISTCLVKQWLHNKSTTYIKYGIKKINYI